MTTTLVFQVSWLRLTASQNTSSYEHDSIRIRVNDMSLVYGGMFDWVNLWGADHTEHREGKHADLAYVKGLNPQGSCTDIENQKDDLKTLIDTYTTDETYTHTTGNPHYHIRMK